MEAMLTGKPRSVAIGALRALVVPLREHWGDLEAFREAGLDVLAKEGGGTLYDEKQSPAHLEQVYRQTVRARAMHFRPIENTAQLETLFKELDLLAAKNTSPLQQGVLWLAMRIQHQAIAYLQQPATEGQVNSVLEAVNPRRNDLERALGDPQKLTLDRIESVLGALAKDVLAGLPGPFEQSVLAGHLLERVRAAARRPPRIDVTTDEAPRNDALTALFAVFLEPVRAAELNEAKARYARLSDAERTRRYNEFRRTLVRIVQDIASFAPHGFDVFCEALETRLYPYPEPLQFIRSFARPIWNSGAQSSAFTNATTPQGVQLLYEQYSASRQGNPVMLELARAFALHNFRGANGDGNAPPLTEVDLKEQFGWPTTIRELQAALREAPKASH